MILLFVAVAWLAGVCLAALGLAWLWPFVLLAGAGGCLGLVTGGRQRDALFGSCLVLLAVAGILRYEDSRPPPPGGIALFNDGAAVSLRGMVSQPPEERERSQRFVLDVVAYKDGDAWQPTEGSVLVTTRLFPRFAYGDELELRVRLETPPVLEGFDYRDYLARRGIVSVAAFPEVRRLGSGGDSDLMRAIHSVRRPFDEALARSLPEPEAALARGILLGQRASIPAGVTDDFNRSGISHLVAISGYNVTLVAGFAVGALSWLLGRRHAIFAAMVIVVVYAVLVGASPSVLRAAVMGIVMLGASLAGRPGSAFNAVCFAGATLTAAQPLIIADVAFQLSFAATLGIVLLAKPMEERFSLLSPRLPGLLAWLAQPAAVTVAATLAVLPIIAASFGRVSLVALPANLLAVPAFPLILAASSLTAVAGAVSTELGRLLGEVTYLPLAYLVEVGEAAASLPFASVAVGDVGTWEAALMYAVIGLACLLVLGRDRPQPLDVRPSLRLKPALMASLAFAVLAVFVWAQELEPDGGMLQVTVLDVGQGDAILIETPAGQRILVDGGPSGNRLVQALGQELPASVRRFDLVVLSHAQDDHVTGLVTVLERYEVTAALVSPLAGETSAYRAWHSELTQRQITVRSAVAGEWADLGNGVRLEVLGPPAGLVTDTRDPLNDNSVVLRLVYGEVSFLLTGDIAEAGEAALLRSGGNLQTTVLKVAHHGSDGSSTAFFLAAAQPDIAVISAGEENQFGHPSPTTLLRLAGVPILRTDLNGSVRVQTDGRSVSVAFERGDYRVVVPSSQR